MTRIIRNRVRKRFNYVFAKERVPATFEMLELLYVGTGFRSVSALSARLLAFIGVCFVRYKPLPTETRNVCFFASQVKGRRELLTITKSIKVSCSFTPLVIR